MRLATIEEVYHFNPNTQYLHKAERTPLANVQAYHIYSRDNSRYGYYNQNQASFQAEIATKPVVLRVERDDTVPTGILDFEISKLNTDDRWGYNALVERNQLAILAKIEVEGQACVVVIPFSSAQKAFDIVITSDLNISVSGITKPLTQWNRILDNPYGYRTANVFDYTLDTLHSIISYRFGYLSKENTKNFILGVIAQGHPVPEVKGSGVHKNVSKIQPFIDELMTEDPIAFCFIRSLIAMSSKTVESVKISSLVNDLLNPVKTKADLLKALASLGDGEKTSFSPESALRELPVWKEKRKAVLKSQGNRAYVKLMEEYDSLKLDEKTYPKTAKAVKSGELALSVFFRKKEQYFLVNDNWDLWEKMLAKHHDKAIELANCVKTRSTYEKDLMSYFYFILYSLPKYLQKHTGKKWTCFPKLVDSQSELEPPAAGDDGITRKRSALTPIVDNEECTVEVPYASLAIGGGYGTTYCYSHDYHVLTEGFSYNGNTVTRDIEKKLNGRDDYGLMYYTLTGSHNGRGYPTFLIIFERKSDETVVHFHRTHPSRSKDGDYNPLHNWIKNCYNWMAGNIPRSKIKAQQGDLVFVETDKDVEFTTEVNSYDKHNFAEPVKYAEGPKDRSINILGYVNLEKDTVLNHTEHDNLTIPAGKYAIHQCRSWEANPRSVMTLRID